MGLKFLVIAKQDGIAFKAASFANIDFHLDVDDDVTAATKGFYDQQELQLLAAANLAGQLYKLWNGRNRGKSRLGD